MNSSLGGPLQAFWLPPKSETWMFRTGSTPNVATENPPVRTTHSHLGQLSSFISGGWVYSKKPQRFPRTLGQFDLKVAFPDQKATNWRCGETAAILALCGIFGRFLKIGLPPIFTIHLRFGFAKKKNIQRAGYPHAFGFPPSIYKVVPPQWCERWWT